MDLPRRPGPSVRVRVTEYVEGRLRTREDRLATEEPLEVRLAWPGHAAERVAVTMRTPGHDFELATGFLHAEGLLDPGDLRGVAYCTDTDLRAEEEFNVVTVDLAGPPPRPLPRRHGTVVAAASACGVCGADSIDDVVDLAGLATLSRPGTPDPIDAAVLLALPDRLRRAQKVFDRTGGLHAAALCSSDGAVLVHREDVGRHNAVDKVVGARLLAGDPPGAPLLVVSGRVGFEIVQKAAVARIGTVAALGAPTSLAVSLARAAEVHVVGFLSPTRYVTYC